MFISCSGSLPTFVDAGSNYESGEIEEDSLLYQFHAANKTMVFMGDDTWISLYPSFFKRKFPFPSFDVKDLDTVDDGIISHMIPEVKTKDWNVLIAHFLGVDHCGHRYGPNHQEMERKLTQIDYFLKYVFHLKTGFHFREFFSEFFSEFAERDSVQRETVFRREVDLLSTFKFC